VAQGPGPPGVSRCECLCAWNRDDQIRTYPDKTVPELGGQAAILALKTPESQSRTSRFRLRKSLPVQCDGRAANPPANRPDRNPRNQRRQRMRHRLDRFSRGLHVSRLGMYDISMAVGVEQMGKQGLLAAPARGPGVLDRRQSRLGPDARGFRPGGYRAHAQVRHQDGALREISVKSHKHATKKSVLAVSQRSLARRRDECAPWSRIRTRFICVARPVTAPQPRFWQ